MLDEQTLYRPFYCEARTRPKGGSYYTNLVVCCACRAFPCRKINQVTYKEILATDLLQAAGGRLRTRRKPMYLFLFPDGTIKPAYEGFDPNNPDWEVLRDVVEVLCVAKTLVPQLKLVPKPKAAPAAAKAPAPKRKPKAKEAA